MLLKSTEFLRSKGIPSPRLEAELLLAHALGLDRVKVYLNFDRPLRDEELEPIRALIRRRASREPYAYIVGRKEFYGRDFSLRGAVLVPRPDTETLVEAVLHHIDAAAPMIYVADVGCGSGCIGLTLAAERPGVRLYACDQSDDALACTRANAEALGCKDRVGVLKGDLLAAVPASRPIDWVVSNPPYIPAADIENLEPEVRDHEPRIALNGGADGLDVYRRLIPAATARARLGVAVEIGIGQAEAVHRLFHEGGLVDVVVHKDLSGTERVILGLKPAGPVAR